MRASFAIAVSVAGLVAGAAPAWAADVPLEASGYETCCHDDYGVAMPVVIYDDQPGVTLRRWWLPPWRNRHYYPHGRERLHTGHAVQSGRRHRARAVRPRSAPSYARYWTNPAARVHTPATLIGPDHYPLPRPNPSNSNYVPPIVVVPPIH